MLEKYIEKKERIYTFFAFTNKKCRKTIGELFYV